MIAGVFNDVAEFCQELDVKATGRRAGGADDESERGRKTRARVLEVIHEVEEAATALGLEVTPGMYVAGGMADG